MNNGGVSANSLNQPTGVALDASGNVYVADIYNNRVLEYGPFGNVNVCPADAATPAPCNNTVSFSYYAANSTDFGATQVVTQGISGLDFSLGSGSTCTGTVTAGNACLVNVNFTPLAPGLRSGAVELFDNLANPLTSAPLYGVGQGPDDRLWARHADHGTGHWTESPIRIGGGCEPAMSSSRITQPTKS